MKSPQDSCTPGPWKLVDHSWSDCSIYGGKDGKKKVCSMSIRDEATEENQEALEMEMGLNARLIEAAPYLLQAVALCHFLLPYTFEALDLDPESQLRIKHPKDGVIYETTAGGLLATLEKAFNKAVKEAAQPT